MRRPRNEQSDPPHIAFQPAWLCVHSSKQHTQKTEGIGLRTGLYALHNTTNTAPEREQGRKHTAPEVIHVLLYTPVALQKRSGVPRTAERGF